MVGGAREGDESEEEDGEDENDRARLEGAVVPAGVGERERSGGQAGFGVGGEGRPGIGRVRMRGKSEVEGVFGWAGRDAAEASGAFS